MPELIAIWHEVSAALGLNGLEFKDPIFLVAIAVAPLVWWLARRRSSVVTYSSNAMARGAVKSWRVRFAWIPAAALAMAAVLLAVALAGPRTGDKTTRVKRDGIAIMLAVDRSGSMDARDFVPEDRRVNRLDAVKTVLKDFVLGGEVTNGRPDDLIGVVAFGTYADSVSPLTLDHANLISIVDQLEVARTPGESATALGEGLGLAIERLRGHEAKSKVVVLLTDGENNAGTLAPLDAARIAVDNGIRIYTVGAGTNGYAPMPTPMGDGRYRLRRAEVSIDETTLKEVARIGGGRYFNATDLEGLADVYAAIDRLERTEIIETRYLRYRDHFFWLVAAALTLMLLAEALNHSIWRRLP